MQNHLPSEVQRDSLLVGSCPYTGEPTYLRVLRCTPKRVIAEELEGEKLGRYSSTPIMHHFSNRLREPLQVVQSARKVTVSLNAKDGWCANIRTRLGVNRVVNIRTYTRGEVIEYSFAHD